MATAETDYYELLEVERSADDGTIKSSYRRLAMRFHPDKNPGDAAAEVKFKAISSAYSCLSDPQKRAAYDRYGHAAFEQGGGGGGQQGFSDLGDIFETIFGNAFNGGGGGRQQARRGADLRYDMEIGLDEAFHGTTEQIEIEVSAKCEPCDGKGAQPGTGTRRCNLCGGHGKVRAQQGFFMVERACPVCRGAGRVISKPCRTCDGAGRVEKEKALQVKVPAGVDDGTRIRLTGEGEAGARSGPAGDLYIFIALKAHRVFQREDTTLFCMAPLPMTTAALGGEVDVPSLDGQKTKVKVPAGTQTGKQFRIRGKGMPALNGAGFGDLVIQVNMETPVNLTKRQRELLEEFQNGETGENAPESAGFFDRLKELWDN